MLFAASVANVASVLSSDQADNHFATVADGLVIVIGIAMLRAPRKRRIMRVVGAIIAIVGVTGVILRITHGVA